MHKHTRLWLRRADQSHMHSTLHTRVSNQRARAGGLPTSCYSKCDGTPWSRNPAFLLMPPASFAPNGTKRGDETTSRVVPSIHANPSKGLGGRCCPGQGSGVQNCLLYRDGVTERMVAAGMREIAIKSTNVTSRFHLYCVARSGPFTDDVYYRQKM